MREIKRRIEVLERGMQPSEGVVLIPVQVGRPASAQADALFCEIDGVLHTCGTDELPPDFEARMRAVAHNLNRRAGRPTRIICGRDDIEL